MGLCKVCPLNDHLQTQCKELYQLHHEISIDERIVWSKAQFSFRQYNYTQQSNKIRIQVVVLIRFSQWVHFVLFCVPWKEWRGEIFEWIRI